jgi:hypothetical protein
MEAEVNAEEMNPEEFTKLTNRFYAGRHCVAAVA